MTESTKYKEELVSRYWGYQQRFFPQIEKCFEQPFVSDGRPPVFLAREAWRNVITQPHANQQQIDRLLALVPKPDRHKWFRSMNSSQALALSVLGNLAIDGLLGCLAEVPDDEGQPFLGRASISSDEFAMEFKIDYLGEPRPTSLDGYFSGSYRVAVECKFTEADVGTCSRPRLRPADSSYQPQHCNGSYSRQGARTERCALTEIGVLLALCAASLQVEQ